MKAVISPKRAVFCLCNLFDIRCVLPPNGIHKGGAGVCGFEVSVGDSYYFDRHLSVNRLPSFRRTS